eukprot:31635-Hanusia_phi.AAC.1
MSNLPAHTAEASSLSAQLLRHNTGQRTFLLSFSAHQGRKSLTRACRPLLLVACMAHRWQAGNVCPTFST